MILVLLVIEGYLIFKIVKSKVRDERRNYLKFVIMVSFILILLSLATFKYYKIQRVWLMCENYEAAGMYKEAYDGYVSIYNEMGYYRDIINRIDSLYEKSVYDTAIDMMRDGYYTDAMYSFLSIIDFGDRQDKFDECVKLYYDKINGGNT